MGIIAFIILGLLAGAIAKAILPGDDPGGFIITAVIGIVGALLGGFIVGLAESLGATLLPGSLKQLVVFALFVLVLLFRPAGLFGGGRGR